MKLFADHPLRQPRFFLPVVALIAVVQLPFLHWAFRGPAPVNAAVPFADNFERASLGDQYFSNGGDWRIVNGQLFSPGVMNNPLWLKARLPADVRIEFDVRSDGPDGDVKCEAFGDGRNHSTGYLFLYGAWHNSESRIAKLDEHAFTEQEIRAHLAQLARPYPHTSEGIDAVVDAVQGPILSWEAQRDLEKLERGAFFRPETPFIVKRPDLKVTRGKTVHFRITKKAGVIRWEIDSALALEMNDPAPLSGPGHDRFGFSSWANDTWFDNLRIEPL